MLARNYLARADKWKSTLRLCTENDSLNHVELHPEIQDHPAPIGNGWMLADGHCRPVRHSSSSLPANIIRTSSIHADETDLSDCESRDSDVDFSVQTTAAATLTNQPFSTLV